MGSVGHRKLRPLGTKCDLNWDSFLVNSQPHPDVDAPQLPLRR